MNEWILGNNKFTCTLTEPVNPWILFSAMNLFPNLTKVIFNEPATIVYWSDKTKTVVKCGEDDTYDKEKGLALCYMKKLFNNKGNYNEILKKWCKEKEEPKKEVPHWVKGKNYIKCSECGCEVVFPVKKCPKCESVMDYSNLMMDED